jgi:hypothetical protein
VNNDKLTPGARGTAFTRPVPFVWLLRTKPATTACSSTRQQPPRHQQHHVSTLCFATPTCSTTCWQSCPTLAGHR